MGKSPRRAQGKAFSAHFTYSTVELRRWLSLASRLSFSRQNSQDLDLSNYELSRPSKTSNREKASRVNDMSLKIDRRSLVAPSGFLPILRVWDQDLVSLTVALTTRIVTNHLLVVI